MALGFLRTTHHHTAFPPHHMSTARKPVLLIIRDGWGRNPHAEPDSVTSANWVADSFTFVAVPEPGAMGLLAAAAILFAIRPRRRGRGPADLAE